MNDEMREKNDITSVGRIADAIRDAAEAKRTEAKVDSTTTFIDEPLGSGDVSELPRLLRSIPQVIHDVQIAQLKEMRQLHPAYRDDQLLILLWARTMQELLNATNKES